MYVVKFTCLFMFGTFFLNYANAISENDKSQIAKRAPATSLERHTSNRTLDDGLSEWLIGLIKERACEKALSRLDFIPLDNLSDTFEVERILKVAKFYVLGDGPSIPSQKSFVVNSSFQLAPSVTLHVDRTGFQINDLAIPLDLNGPDAPSRNSLMRSGPASWLFSVVDKDDREIKVFGISAPTAENIEVEFLFRVVIFSEGIESAPFLGFGPSITYKGKDKHLHFYIFDTPGSGDVESVIGGMNGDMRMSQVLAGKLEDVEFHKTGKLTYKAGGMRHSIQIFSEMWDDFLRVLKVWYRR